MYLSFFFSFFFALLNLNWIKQMLHRFVFLMWYRDRLYIRRPRIAPSPWIDGRDAIATVGSGGTRRARARGAHVISSSNCRLWLRPRKRGRHVEPGLTEKPARRENLRVLAFCFTERRRDRDDRDARLRISDSLRLRRRLRPRVAIARRAAWSDPTRRFGSSEEEDGRRGCVRLGGGRARYARSLCLLRDGNGDASFSAARDRARRPPEGSSRHRLHREGSVLFGSVRFGSVLLSLSRSLNGRRMLMRFFLLPSPSSRQIIEEEQLQLKK